jgi:hypothetical protein
MKVLAARLGTTSGNIAGVEARSRGWLKGGRALLFSFSKRTHLAKSDPSFSNL